jgi:hypothetical protein
MKPPFTLVCAAALASVATAPAALAHGVRWGAPPAAHIAVHTPAPAHRRAIPPPVFVPPVVTFNPFVPAFVAATPIVVYAGTLPAGPQPRIGAWPASATPAAAVTPRTPGTGTWIVGEMPARVAAPAPRTHAGERVLEIRRSSR